jgi:protein Mpv17
MQQSLMMRNPFKQIWHAYERQLARSPVATQVTTSGLLWGMGDLLAQRIEHYEQRRQQANAAASAPQVVPGVPKSSSSLPQSSQQPPAAAGAAEGAAATAAAGDAISIDWRRAALTGVFGATLVGPVGHFWYLGIDKVCAKWLTPGSAAFIATKVIVDTAAMGPFYVSTFFGFGTACIDGGTWSDFTSKMRKDFVPTLAAEVTFWPVVQTFNFARVPVQHQLLVVNSMTIVDAAFMSWARNHEDWLGTLLEKWKAYNERHGTPVMPSSSSSSSGKAVALLPVEPLKLEKSSKSK